MWFCRRQKVVQTTSGESRTSRSTKYHIYISVIVLVLPCQKRFVLIVTKKNQEMLATLGNKSLNAAFILLLIIWLWVVLTDCINRRLLCVPVNKTLLLNDFCTYRSPKTKGKFPVALRTKKSREKEKLFSVPERNQNTDSLLVYMVQSMQEAPVGENFFLCDLMAVQPQWRSRKIARILKEKIKTWKTVPSEAGCDCKTCPLKEIRKKTEGKTQLEKACSFAPLV